MKNERKEPIQIPHIQTINDYISYLTPTEHPLSANVVIIEGDAFFWVYDVGNHPAVSEILQKKSEQTGKEIRVILSHFHPDHIGNLSEISCEAVYQGKNTFRYTKTGTVIEEDTWFQDGDVRLHFFRFHRVMPKDRLHWKWMRRGAFSGMRHMRRRKTDRPFIMPSACWQKSEF